MLDNNKIAIGNAYPVPQEASTSSTTFSATEFESRMSGSQSTLVSSLHCRMNSIDGNPFAQQVRSALRWDEYLCK